MKWKQWKIGALVSVLLSAAVAGAGVSVGGRWQTVLAVFCAALVTHFGAYLKDHPVESISFDTDHTTKDQNQNTGTK